MVSSIRVLADPQILNCDRFMLEAWLIQTRTYSAVRKATQTMRSFNVWPTSPTEALLLDQKENSDWYKIDDLCKIQRWNQERCVNL